MGKISFNPTIYAPDAPNVPIPKVQYNDFEVKAYNHMAKSFSDGLGDLDKVFKKNKEDQFNVDMIAGESMLNTLDAKRKEEIQNIPIESGVNYEEQTNKINSKYNKEWDKWSKTNIRNLDNEDIERLRKTASMKFENGGDEFSAIYGIDYEKKRNINSIELTEGLAAQRLEENPNDESAKQQLMNAQFMRTNIGVQTESEEQQNKYAIEQRINKRNDEIVETDVKNLVFDGDYEQAEKRMEDYSDNVTEPLKQQRRNQLFASSTYNRFNAMASDIRTLDDVEQYKKQVKADTYMSEDKHKQILFNRADRAEQQIVKNRKRNLKSFIKDAENRELNFEQLETALADDTETGVYHDGDPETIERRLLSIQNIAVGEELREQDKDEYKKASKKPDSGGVEKVYDEHQDLLGFQLKGDMQLQQFDSRMKKYDKWLKNNEISVPVHRQLQRELVNSLAIGLEDDQMIKDMSVWKPWVTNEDLTHNEISIYKSLTKTYQQQNEAVGKFIEDENTSFKTVSEDVRQWVDANPDASPSETKEFIEKTIKPIRLLTLRELLRK